MKQITFVRGSKQKEGKLKEVVARESVERNLEFKNAPGEAGETHIRRKNKKAKQKANLSKDTGK